jgi:uncharacterized membrane protein YedE/YeeE
MTVDWLAFTPVSALIGGCLIGFAAALLMVANGRIMGASGILAGLIVPSKAGTGDEEDKFWRWLFIAGTVFGPLFVWLAGGKAIEIQPVASGLMLPAAGLLVGFGAAFGSGCTSGHGICGLARLSFRSLVAVLSFMASGLITVYLIRHLL